MSTSNVNKGQFVNNVSSEEGKEKAMKIPYVVKGKDFGIAIKEEDGVLTVVANGKVVSVLAARVQAVKALPTRRVNGVVYAITKQGFVNLNSGATLSEEEVMTPPEDNSGLPVFVEKSAYRKQTRVNVPVPTDADFERVPPRYRGNC
jgi:hypothetical protein